MKEGAQFIQWAKNNGHGKIIVSPEALAVFVEYLDYLYNQNNKPFDIANVSVSLPVEKANEARYAYAADYSPELRCDIEEAHLAGQRFVMKQLGLELIYDNER